MSDLQKIAEALVAAQSEYGWCDAFKREIQQLNYSLVSPLKIARPVWEDEVTITVTLGLRVSREYDDALPKYIVVSEGEALSDVDPSNYGSARDTEELDDDGVLHILRNGYARIVAARVHRNEDGGVAAESALTINVSESERLY